MVGARHEREPYFCCPDYLKVRARNNNRMQQKSDRLSRRHFQRQLWNLQAIPQTR